MKATRLKASPGAMRCSSKPQHGGIERKIGDVRVETWAVPICSTYTILHLSRRTHLFPESEPSSTPWCTSRCRRAQ